MKEFGNGVTATFKPPYFWEVKKDGQFIGNVEDNELIEFIEERQLPRPTTKVAEVGACKSSS